MPIALDGFDVFQQIGKHAELFSPIRADVEKQAMALIVKCLKAKSVNLDGIRAMFKALGQAQFGLVLDGLKDADIKSVLTRIDKHHPDVKQGSAGWRRDHFNALADGSSSLHAAPVKARKTAARKAKAEPARLKNEVVDVYRQSKKKEG
jgi:hypothetical protein